MRAWIGVGVVAAALALLAVACGSDQLVPVSGFKPSDCKPNDRTCGEQGVRLDSGLRMPVADSGTEVQEEPDSGDNNEMPDAGFGEPDLGLPDLGPADSGVPPDSGVISRPDTGPMMPPDSGPPPTEFLDLNGQWHTRYDFDLSRYLFGIGGIAPTLDRIDQALHGHLHTGLPPPFGTIVDAWLGGIIQQYVPQWLVNVVHVLNELANLFRDVHVNGGLMTIRQDPPASPSAPTTALHATETWTEMVLMLIDRCPLGRADPGYPGCAEYHVPVTHNPQMVGPLQVLVTIDPFDGTLNAGYPEADFVLHRTIHMQLTRLILLVADTLVSFLTPYHTLSDALHHAVDCGALARRVRDYVEPTIGTIPAIALEVTVRNQCNNFLDGLVGQIGGVPVTFEAMDFDQHGHAIATPPSRRPYVLQQMTVPNTISGHFRFAIQSSMGGTWEGVP